jgi:hypothetical protein
LINFSGNWQSSAVSIVAWAVAVCASQALASIRTRTHRSCHAPNSRNLPG